MTRTRAALRVAAWAIAQSASAALALPDLDAVQQIEGLRFYPDHERESVFYYGPGDLRLATDPSGAPGLHFLQMRYTGTSAYGDQGESGSFSTLTLHIAMDTPPREKLAAARLAIGRRVARARIELRPLPITNFQAVLAYAPVGGDESEKTGVAKGGHFEADGAREGESSAESFWSERVFSIAMDPESSQLFWQLLQEGEVALSIAYAFSSRGIASSQIPDIEVDANSRGAKEDFLDALAAAGVPRREEKLGVAGKLLEQVMDTGIFGGEARERKEREPTELPTETRVVHASATGIRIDAKRWPELFQRVDFNEAAPPGYGALRVYCYDFKDGLRPDLFFKKVEIAATAVGGREAELAFKFLKSQPDLYARSVRFDIAVLLDHPYRYRVTAAKRDGTLDVGPWVERQSWSEILDVTSRPDEATPQPEQAVENAEETE